MGISIYMISIHLKMKIDTIYSKCRLFMDHVGHIYQIYRPRVWTSGELIRSRLPTLTGTAPGLGSIVCSFHFPEYYSVLKRMVYEALFVKGRQALHKNRLSRNQLYIVYLSPRGSPISYM